MAQTITIDLTDADEADFALFSIVPIEGYAEYLKSLKRNASQQRFEQAKTDFGKIPLEKQSELLKTFSDAVVAEVEKLPKDTVPPVTPPIPPIKPIK